MKGFNKNKEDQVLAKLAAEVEAATLQNTEKKPQSQVDHYLKVSAIALAVVCAMLPVVTYLQRVDLSPSKKNDTKITDPLNRTDQKTVRHFPSFRPNEEAASNEGIDTMKTGSIMSNGKGLPGATDGQGGEGSSEGKPLPKPVFALREVVGSMAMIEDISGYWFVEKGSLLPDGSRLVSIRRGQSGGNWQLTTSTGGVIDMRR